jgi:hypothetical protein
MAEIDTAELDTAELDTAELVRAELVRVELDTAELDTAELDTAELDTRRRSSTRRSSSRRSSTGREATLLTAETTPVVLSGRGRHQLCCLDGGDMSCVRLRRGRPQLASCVVRTRAARVVLSG